MTADRLLDAAVILSVAALAWPALALMVRRDRKRGA